MHSVKSLRVDGNVTNMQQWAGELWLGIFSVITVILFDQKTEKKWDIVYISQNFRNINLLWWPVVFLILHSLYLLITSLILFKISRKRPVWGKKRKGKHVRSGLGSWVNPSGFRFSVNLSALWMRRAKQTGYSCQTLRRGDAWGGHEEKAKEGWRRDVCREQKRGQGEGWWNVLQRDAPAKAPHLHSDTTNPLRKQTIASRGRIVSSVNSHNSILSCTHYAPNPLVWSISLSSMF